VFHGFVKVKFVYDDSVLGSSQFSILPKLPPKIMLNSKVVKIDPKTVISLRKSKSVKNVVVHEEDVEEPKPEPEEGSSSSPAR